MNKLRGFVITIIFFAFASLALAETTAFTADLRGSLISPLASPMKGAAILTEDQVKALLGGTMYINVHSATYPDGEIRGQITPAS